MTQYCYNCGSEIDAVAPICPYCSARQTKPGDPFIGFLIYHAMNFFGSTPWLNYPRNFGLANIVLVVLTI